jgi:predicted metal-binding membrane protein
VAGVARSIALPGRPASPGPRGLATIAARVPAVTLAIAAAWLLLAGAQAIGAAGLLHHHTLIEHGPALWVALPVFLAAWLVMVVAMMLPASLPAIGSHLAAVGRAARDVDARPARPLAAFLAPYLLVWAGFGVAVFLGDTLVHRLVHAAPWLAARPWLIDAAVLGFAGAYQLLPIKQRSLDACRHPRPAGARFRPGLDHALACLAGSWALMLLMFSEGFSSPAWMVGLAAVMTYEATGRHGHVVAKLVGLLLVLVALGVVVAGRAF